MIRWLVTLCCVTLTFFGNIYAQVDTEFWFAAPEVSGGRNLDKPILLRITTFEEAATVQAEQPALGFASPAVNIPPFTSRTIDLTPLINQIENKPPNRVLNFGIHITATARISAYYEVASTFCNCNPEIFVLKGSNALGTHFMVPFQNRWLNSDPFRPLPFASFDIVATEDETTVTIIPTRNLVGHAAGTPYTITLNRGQTYAAQAAGQRADQHPAGSEVIADKPIAITMKDDLLFYGTCNDLIGDQIVPIEVTGTEYILMRGFMTLDEYAFVLATEDNTQVFIDGGAAPIAVLAKGETFAVNVANPTHYLNTSAPVYVLHTSGYGCEMGAAILPSIDCTGSESIGFARSSPERLGINIMARAGSEGDFELNGNPGLIPAADFNPVPGTAGEWVYAQFEFNNATLPAGEAHILTNSSDLFHAGIINGDVRSGTRFGYFSDYTVLNLGDDITMCKGDTALLDAGPYRDSYLWSTGSREQSIAVTDTGEYVVEITRRSCRITDTLHVRFHPPTGAQFGPDTLLCEGTVLPLDVTTPDSRYLWQDGSTQPTLTVDRAGLFWAEVEDSFGCVERDSLAITYGDVPELALSEDTVLCGPEELQLEAIVANDSLETQYLWRVSRSTTPILSVTPDASAWYSMTASNICGDVQDSVRVEVLAPLAITAEVGEVSCANAADGYIALTVSGGSGGYDYIWSQGGPNNARVDNLTGDTYTVQIVDQLGCETDTLIEIIEPNELTLAVSNLQDVSCNGFSDGNFSITAVGGTPAYVFQLDSEPFVDVPDFRDLLAGTYTVQVWDSRDCQTATTVSLAEPPALSIEVVASADASCDLPNGQIEVVAAGGSGTGYQYLWDTPVPLTGASVDQLAAGTYRVQVVDAQGCTDSSEVVVGAIPPASAGFETQVDSGQEIIIPGPGLILRNLSEHAVEYRWDMGDGTTYNISDPIHEYEDEGSYVISLIAFDSTYQCPDVFELPIEVVLRGRLFFPTAFSPNNDGVNDEFWVGGGGVESFQLQIFNRWGKLVRTFTALDEKWDGRSQQGNMLPEGVYVFTCRVLYNTGQVEERGGSITLVR